MNCKDLFNDNKELVFDLNRQTPIVAINVIELT